MTLEIENKMKRFLGLPLLVIWLSGFGCAVLRVNYLREEHAKLQAVFIKTGPHSTKDIVAGMKPLAQLNDYIRSTAGIFFLVSTVLFMLLLRTSKVSRHATLLFLLIVVWTFVIGFSR